MSRLPADLAATRYGKRTTPRWVWFVVTAVLIAAGIAWAWWAAQRHADQPVSAQVRSFSVASVHRTNVELEVHRRDGAAAECDVYAQAKDHSLVGERMVTVDASDQETVLVSVAITTERRAVSAALRNCRLTR